MTKVKMQVTLPGETGGVPKTLVAGMKDISATLGASGAIHNDKIRWLLTDTGNGLPIHREKIQPPEVIYQFHSAARHYFRVWILGRHLLCHCHPTDGQFGLHERHPREQDQGLGPNGIRDGDKGFIYERSWHAYYHDRHPDRLAVVDLW